MTLADRIRLWRYPRDFRVYLVSTPVYDMFGDLKRSEVRVVARSATDAVETLGLYAASFLSSFRVRVEATKEALEVRQVRGKLVCEPSS